MSFHPNHVTRCDQCGRAGADQAGISVARLDRLCPDEFGFCSLVCMVLFVRARYMEAANA